ncbi:nucleoside deaminase [Sinomonas sp. ASV322]|uniref:nucleoside deaminase n=1 Tax=Sinomonas sp. ASV322 TaxID=3041920 RepID=UPI0027DC3ADE|nr:nucleoside deaminase [Sinomonas sp. ASV322]MDQ4502714.1 nucleoside deaminase [Sinomonas sp. ASV322]
MDEDAVRRHLERAVELATANVAEGGGPFGAVVVMPDGTIFEGTNRVTRDNDPTAHAEVVAIRRAAAGTRDFDLHGAALYTSCEPCPLCLSAALWARISAVYFAADRHDAAAAGFDDAEFYEYFDGDDRSRMPVARSELAQRTAPFDAWAAFTARVEY